MPSQDTKDLLLNYVENQKIEEVRNLLNENKNLSKVVYNVFDEKRTMISDGSILYHAAKIGNLEMCQMLLDFGALANVGRLNPVIFGAVESGNIEIVKLLIENGASPKAISLSSRNRKVVDFARRNGNEDIAVFLEEKIAERTQKNSELDEISFTEPNEESHLLNRPSPFPEKKGVTLLLEKVARLFR